MPDDDDDDVITHTNTHTLMHWRGFHGAVKSQFWTVCMTEADGSLGLVVTVF